MLKKILIGVVVLLVLVIGGGIAFLKSFDVNQYRGLITEQAKKATGRDLTLGGDLKLEISLTPSVVVENVAFANAAWGSRKEMVKLKRLEAQVELLPLISKQVKVARIVLIEPDILLETDAKGVGNWVFDAGAAPAKDTKAAPAKGGDTPIPVVKKVLIEKANLTYKDGKTKQTTSLMLAKLEASADGLDSPLKLDLAGSFNNNPFSMTGALGSANALLGGKPFGVDIEAKAGGATVKVKGTIAKPMEGTGLDLALNAAGEDIATLAALGGAKLHKIGPYSVAGKLTGGGNAFALDGLAVKIAGSDLGGKVAVNLGGAKPTVDANLASEKFDLKDVSPPESANQKKAPAAKDTPKAATSGDKRVFPADPLPLDGLRAANAKLVYKAKRLLTPAMPLDDLSVNLALTNGKLEIAPVKAAVGGGSFAADATLDGSAANPTLVAKVNGQQIELGKMLADLKINDIMTGGKTDAAIDLRGVGGSVRALMAGLNGRMLITVGPGKINNSKVDLAGADLLNELGNAVNPFAKKDTHTELSCAVVKFDIHDGMAKSDKGIAVETSKMTVQGAGTANLKTEGLDFGVKTDSKQGMGLGLGALSQMVRLQGTMGEPKIGIDAAEAGKAALKVGAAIATGGLSSVVGGLMDKGTGGGSDPAPCNTALGKAPPPQAAQPAQPTGGAAKAPAPAPTGPAGAVEGLGKGLGKLFGK